LIETLIARHKRIDMHRTISFAPDPAVAHFAAARLCFVKVRDMFPIEFQRGKHGWVSISFLASMNPD
jgi:hypothetical protein